MRALVVSLHDVSPSTWSACATIIQHLHAHGISRTSLLIIPDHHGRGPFWENAPFTQAIQTLIQRGHEPVLHGYTHQRPRSPSEKLRRRLITQGYTAGEGEFYDLDYPTAAARLRAGLDGFTRAHIQPTGFIAPAWLLSHEAQRAVTAVGLRYTTRLRTFIHLPSGLEIPAPSLCWSVRAAWRRAASIMWNAHLYHRLRATPLLRIAIHPVDIQHPRIWAQILRILDAARTSRQIHTYATWLAAQAELPTSAG